MLLTIKQQLIAEICLLVGNSFNSKDLTNLSIKVEYPPNISLGDYATPVALENARLFQMKPQLAAQAIIDTFSELKNTQDFIIGSLSMAGPGFLNIRLADEILKKQVTGIVNSKNFGFNILTEQKKETSDLVSSNSFKDDFLPNSSYMSLIEDKILLEYVSANPTGPLNVVSARAASVGGTLYRVWKYLGVDVSSEFYVNDYGNQVDKLALSVAARFLMSKGIKVEFPADGYHGDYVYEIAKHCEEKFNKELISKNWKEQDLPELAELFRDSALAFNIQGQKDDLLNFGIEFDNWFSEKTLYEEKKPESTYKVLEAKNVIYDEEGKKVFRSTDFGDDKDRVVIRDDGRPTYFMADIAYHLDKLKRGFQKLINIWGPDHHGYIARLRGAIQALGYPENTLEVLIAQQVNLLDDGEMVKMSKREGKLITLRELIAEIPLDVVRFFFVMRAMDSPLDFDMKLAKQQSMENPVYYIQYAHARISSVSRENEKADFPEKINATLNLEGDSLQLLFSEETRRNLALYMLRFPDELLEIGRSREVHRLTIYLHELAGHFQRFYQNRQNRVIGGDQELQSALLFLMLACRNILAIGLRLLGVSAPEKM